jgi:hypothetical protein
MMPYQSDDIWMPDFFQNVNLSLQYLDFGYFGLSDGLYGIPFSCFSMPAFSHHTIMPMADLFGIYVIAVYGGHEQANKKLQINQSTMSLATHTEPQTHQQKRLTSPSHPTKRR